MGKFFKTGRSAATRAANNAARVTSQTAQEILDFVREQYENAEGYYDDVMDGYRSAYRSLGDLLSSAYTPREMPDAPAVVSADPALVGQAEQVARMPFTNRLRNLRRQVGGRSGSGSGGLGAHLSGNALEADRAASRAAFDAQRALQDQALQQERENEELRYSYEVSEQERPFTQTRAIAQDMLSTSNVSPYYNSLVSAMGGRATGAQTAANIYAKNVRPGLASQILAPVAGAYIGNKPSFGGKPISFGAFA